MVYRTNGRDRPRVTHTHDCVSGEDLIVIFYPKAGRIIINGDTVVLSRGFSGREGESVFHPALGGRKYTVATDVIVDLCF